MPTKDMPDIKTGEDYAIRPQTRDEKKKWNEAEVPEYRVELDLADTQIEELREQVFMEFKALKEERRELGLDDKWDARERQYDGQLQQVKGIEFQIDVRESKIKVDNIVRAIKEAFLPDDGDIIEITPRPETARNDGWEIAEQQQQFLDYAMDEEIKPEEAIASAATCACKKYVGMIKKVWEFDQETRRREEHWDGTIEQIEVAPGRMMPDFVGLRNFLLAYPDAHKKYPSQVKRLSQGKSVDIVVAYKEVIKNNPEYQFVPIKDFYVRNGCKRNAGLRTEHLIGERRRFTYWDLKKLEASGEFVNVDQLWQEADKDDDGSKSYMTKEYDVMEFTTYMQVNDTDQEETKIKCWFSEEDEIFLGACIYPYYAMDCDYTAYYLTDNGKGFYGDAEGVMFDLRDTHLAQDALISLMLHSIYIRNTITPIVKEGSDAADQFFDNTFENGRPIVVDDMTDDVNKAFDFVRWPATDSNGGLMLLEKMKRIGSDVSRVSDLATGGESQLDPDAPASKTIALLQQSGLGIKDYIKTFKPSFDKDSGELLQLYYQMSTEDRKYRINRKGKQVTGKEIFGSISREQMTMRTNVQSRAASFVFDKVQEKQEAMAAYQLVNSDPWASRQVKLRYKSLKTLLSTFGGRWDTMADVDMMSPEEFEQQQQAIAMQAVQALFQQAQQQAQVTGVAPDMQNILKMAPQAITQAQMAAYDPQAAAEAEKEDKKK